MNKSKLLFVLIIIVIFINVVFVYLGFEIFNTEKEITKKRIQAYHLSIMDLVSKRLDNLVTQLESLVLSTLDKKTDIDDIKSKLKQLKSSNLLIDEFYVLDNLQAKTGSSALDFILEKYCSKPKNTNIVRFFEIFSDKYYTVDIIKHKNLILVLQINIKHLLKVLKKDIEILAPSLETVIAIIDNSEKVIMSSEPIQPSLKLETMDLKNIFTFWKIGISAKNLEDIEKQREEKIKIYIKIFVALVIIMVITIYFMILVIVRELEIVKMQSEFVSNVSHDLKTPLTAIRIFAEMLRDGKVKKTKFQSYLNTILSESERLSFLINNVLEFSKGSKRSLSLKPLDVVKVINEAISIIKPYAVQKGYQIKFEYDKNIPLISGDKVSLIQAILNLIDNAIKYSLEVKKVLVKISLIDDKVLVLVKDRGIGIDKNEQKKIFDKFYRANDEEVKNIKGIGIGLTIVREIIKNHKGKLYLESEKGKGSKFIIALPLRGDL
ncbi:MAG: HAMP domain-containing sensor histidine kinase [Candidatus Firestonebacteria bacterium]